MSGQLPAIGLLSNPLGFYLLGSFANNGPEYRGCARRGLAPVTSESNLPGTTNSEDIYDLCPKFLPRFNIIDMLTFQV